MPANFDAYQDIIPEETYPVLGMRIISYLNMEGETKYGFRYSGDSAVTEIIGLLELIKAKLISQALEFE